MAGGTVRMLAGKLPERKARKKARQDAGQRGRKAIEDREGWQGRRETDSLLSKPTTRTMEEM